jgi:hypothetical protein
MHGNTVNKITEYLEVDFNHIKNNIKLYSDSLISNGVIVFKKLFASEEQQKELVTLFGDFCGWVPNSVIPIVNSLRYQENHEVSIKLKENGLRSKDEILINWHLEHPYTKDPPIAGLWNNINFKCNPKFGKTGFVDMRKVYEIIPFQEWKDLLDVSDWLFPWSNRIKPMVEKHRITGENILRYDVMHFESTANIVNGIQPNVQETQILEKILDWAITQIKTNENIQQWHEWDEGDMVVADLQVSCHCVTDGFLSSEREFIGYFCHEKNTSDKERESEIMFLTRMLTSSVGIEDPNESFRD